MSVEIGSIVRVTAAGSRDDKGETRQIPAIVTRIWDDGSLELFAFHFEGAHLIRSVPLKDVEMVGQKPVPLKSLVDKFSLAK